MYPSGRWNDAIGEGTVPAVIIEYPSAGPECPADLTGDGLVDGADLTSLLGAWGASGSSADLDGSGTVDGGDLTILLGAWGSCL